MSNVESRISHHARLGEVPESHVAYGHECTSVMSAMSTGSLMRSQKKSFETFCFNLSHTDTVYMEYMDMDTAQRAEVATARMRGGGVSDGENQSKQQQQLQQKQQLWHVAWKSPSSATGCVAERSAWPGFRAASCGALRGHRRVGRDVKWKFGETKHVHAAPRWSSSSPHDDANARCEIRDSTFDFGANAGVHCM